MKFSAIRSQILASIPLAMFLLAGSVAAQTSEGPRIPETAAKLFDCRKIRDADERLACFDREVDAVIAAQQSSEIVITDQKQIQETREDLFGYNIPERGVLASGAEEAPKINQVTERLAEYRERSRGRDLIVLENGAKWMKTDSVPVIGTPKAGEEVTIKKGALGSYMIKISKRRAFRARRVD